MDDLDDFSQLFLFSIIQLVGAQNHQFAAELFAQRADEE